MNSQCLYDEGEEHWTLKYHLGCGGIYLDGYINCDIAGELATQRPDLVAQNATTIKDYYARLDGSIHNLPIRRMTVCDLITNVSHLMSQPNCVDKILAIQVLEHLSPIQALEALERWHSALRDRHPLVLSVPDMEGTLDMIGGQDDIYFALRHLRGSKRGDDDYNTHHAWYTAETLIELVERFGFYVTRLHNFHFYPAVVIRAIKA